MIGSVDLYGLKVENISPINLSSTVNLDAEIKVTFNGDLNTGSIPGSILVISDEKNTFKDMSSLQNQYVYPQVEGTVSYKDKTITFRPKNNLQANTRHIVIIINSVQDILLRKMTASFYSSFYTGSGIVILPMVFMSPKDNSTYNKMPEFTWTTSNTALYTFQISNSLTFESILYEKETTQTALTPEIEIQNGTYYARVKSVSTQWSRLLQFHLSLSEEFPVNSEDEIFDLSLLSELEEANFEVLEIFPKDNAVGIDTRLKTIYVKVSGKVEYSDLNIYDSFIKGIVYDEEDEELIEHGELDYKLVISYDDIENISYIIINLS